ncbi:hypothetical protein D3C76_1509790 [compost metagenome]
MALAVFVQVLEQRLPRQFHAAFEQVRQAPVAQRDIVFHAALATELEPNGAALYLDVAIAQRGQSV